MSNSRILPEFDLLVPQNISEAVDMTAKYGDKAAILSGGTDLMIMLQNGSASPEHVIALGEIDDMDYIKYSKSDGLRIGALATISQIIENPTVKKNYPALWQACKVHSAPQIRNVATPLGNIMRASPSGDCSCALLALGAAIVLEGTSGKREVPLDDFFIDYAKTARKADEIAVEIKVPPAKDGIVSSFMRLTRTNFDLSKVNAAVQLDMSGKTCNDARIAMGAVAPTTIRIKKAEALLKGAKITDDLLKKVGATVAKEIRPIDDVRSTADYRRDVSGVIVQRAIKACL